MKWQVSLNNNSFDRAGITKDCKEAVCEYIWNGFEAGATRVTVSLQGSPLTEAMSLVIADNGTGIPFESLNETFGAFLSSTKNDLSIRIKSQANKGKGRFSYLSFSSSAEWRTLYNSDGELRSYVINTDSTDRSKFDTTELNTEKSTDETGTSVIFPILDAAIVDQLSYENMRQKLLEEFAWYLYLNKEKNASLLYMGIPLEYAQYINTDLSNAVSRIIDANHFKIDLIVWNSSVSNSSKIYYLSENGEIIATENTSFNKNKVNFYHAVFVSSKFFKPDMFFPPEEENDQFEFETQSEQRTVIRKLRKDISSFVSETLKAFLVRQADERLAEMQKRGNYPYFSDDDYGQLRKKDFENVTRELYCVEPRIFYRLNDTQEKSLLGFLNLLLSSEERENVLQIIEQVVNLTSEQRKSFAEILKRTKLQYIVEAISIIEKRVAVVTELKKMVFDYTCFVNERDHIQKLIEQHFWLFGEQYNMLTADKNMRTSLQEFESITKPNIYYESQSVTTENGDLQRIDIFLYTQRIQENSCSEMLIIELKAPHVRLTLDVFNQISRYAHTIRKEPRFLSGNRVWKFFAICSKIDDDVKTKYKNFEQYGKKGLADIIENFELYALSWDDVFQSFEARHSFLLDRLKLDYSQVSKELGFSNTTPQSKTDVTALTQKLIALKAK